MDALLPDFSVGNEGDAEFLAFLNQPLPSFPEADAPVPGVFSDFPAQDSVIPSLVSSSGQHKQQAATYSPQQFPSSWSSYVGELHAEMQQQEQQEQKASLHASTPASSFDSQPQSTLEARQERQREKNRRAMKKFRERQKEKSQESQTKMQDLAKQLESLQLENEQLQCQCRTLKLANIAQQAVPRPPDDQDGATEEWEPGRGWTDFNPHSTMVLHLGRSPTEKPLRFTALQMRTLTHSQFVALLRTYVMRSARLLVDAGDDLLSPSALQLQVIKDEMNAVAANLAINNPALLHCGWGVAPEGSPETPVHAPLPEDVKQACLHLLGVLKITAEQRAIMRKVHELVKADVQRLKAERGNILVSLVENHNDEEAIFEPKSFPGILSGLKRLTKNTEDMHRCLCIYSSSLFRTVLNPIQIAKFMIHSFPAPPNIWLLTAAVAETALDCTEEVSGLYAQMEDRYRQVWRWHSSVTQAGRLHDSPITTTNDYAHNDLVAASRP